MRELFGVPFLRVPIHSSSNHLPNVPTPGSITLGIRLQCMNWEGHLESVAVSHRVEEGAQPEKPEP